MNDLDKFKLRDQRVIKKLELVVLSAQNEPVRTYHILYDPSEGVRYKLRMGNFVYSMTADGKLKPVDVQEDNQIPNPKFTPYD